MGGRKSKSANITSITQPAKGGQHGTKSGFIGVEERHSKSLEESEINDMDELKVEVAELDDRLKHFRAKMEHFLEKHREVQRRLYEAEEQAATAEQYKEWYESALAEKGLVEHKYEEMKTKYSRLRDKVKENASSSDESDDDGKVVADPIKPTRKVKK